MFLFAAATAASGITPDVPGQPVWHCWEDGSIDPGHHNYSAMSVLSQNEAWIAGAFGSFLHYDGDAW